LQILLLIIILLFDGVFLSTIPPEIPNLSITFL
jgi:hypothetical protein